VEGLEARDGFLNRASRYQGEEHRRGSAALLGGQSLQPDGEVALKEAKMALESGRTLEERYNSAIAGFYARFRSNYEFLYEKFGDKGMELIAEMSRRYELEVAERARKKVKGSDAITVAKHLLRIFETASGGKEDKEASGIVKMTENRVVIKATWCPLQFDKLEMCLAHTNMEKTVVEALSPSLTHRIGKSIAAGDLYCEHIIEKKES
jgi:hypothetical protein